MRSFLGAAIAALIRLTATAAETKANEVATLVVTARVNNKGSVGKSDAHSSSANLASCHFLQSNLAQATLD